MTDKDIKEMLFKMTRTTCGKISHGYQDLNESLQRYKDFKEWLKTEIPDFTESEIVKYYFNQYQLKRLFDWSGHELFLKILEKEKIIKNLKIKDFYFQPYGCIHYIDLEDKENIYLNRLKEQYKEIFKFENWSEYKRERQNDYQAMRLFCLETQLITLDDIELMENEISSSF